tara:strand:+ start:596 stop:1321 length:726 start_codon:yes stop_codon:yes gene_type:complete
MYVVPPFEYFVGSIPNTQEAAALHISYELMNVTLLLWRFHSDIMFSRFSKNSRQYRAMIELFDPGSLKCILDDIVCQMFPRYKIDLLEVFPDAPRAEALVGKDTLSPTDLFYGRKLVIKSLRDLYNGGAKRERPLPRKFSYENMRRLRPILLRYAKCMELIVSFSKTVNVRYKLKKKMLKVARRLHYVMEQTKVYPLIQEFEHLGLPAGHTPETLAEFTFEQVKDMLEGHPSKLEESLIDT